MVPEYCLTDITHIIYQGSYCWIHGFILKPYHASKTYNANSRKKVLQEAGTCKYIKGSIMWVQPHK